MSEHDKKALAACRTLEHSGYTYHGGELWKPPLGSCPMPLLEQIEALQAENESLKAQIEAAKNQEPIGILAYRFVTGFEFNQMESSDALRIEGSRHKVYAAPLPPMLRDMSDEELFDAASNFDCGTHGENTEWRLNSPVELRELHDAIIKAAREAV